MERLILQLGLFTIYFHIGGLATTNILRLTKGNKADVNYRYCTCDNCGYFIPPMLQFPVISWDRNSHIPAWFRNHCNCWNVSTDSTYRFHANWRTFKFCIL